MRTDNGTTAAYFIMIAMFAHSDQGRFFKLGDDGSMGHTSCPHEASLFTHKHRVEGLAEQLRRAGFGTVYIVPCRTSQPFVFTGPGEHHD